jgi:hypothetical protein
MPHATVDFTLMRDAFGRLSLLRADGGRVEDIEPVRAFPISAPDGYVSIRDAAGRELLWIESLAEVPTETRVLLEEELARREFMPIIRRIYSVTFTASPLEWRVETDRGKTAFLMDDGDNDVRRLGPHGMLLLDVHGIRYLIPDTRRLDAASRRVFDRYL